MIEEIHERIRKGKFVRLNENTKIPIDPKWTTENNYDFDNPVIQEHMKENNLGFLCGSDDIYVLDLDDKSLLEEFEKLLGQTFTVETPHGFHLYFRIKESKNG